MSPFQKASLLAQERAELRAELLGAQKALQSAFLGFLTIVGATTGLFVSQWGSPGGQTSAVVCFALSQAEFLVGVYTASLILGINGHSAYIRCIEEVINGLATQKLVMWESEVGSTYFAWGKKSPFVWTASTIASVLVATFGVLLFSSVSALPEWFVSVLGFAEATFVICLLLLSAREKERLYVELRAKYGLAGQAG